MRWLHASDPLIPSHFKLVRQRLWQPARLQLGLVGEVVAARQYIYAML